MEKKEALKKQIAERLKLARELSGLSQAQAAKILSFSRPTITEIEQGRRNVTGAELVQFSDTYDVDVNWILSGTEDEAANSKIQLAAREISKMSEGEVDKLFKLLSSMKKSG
jgi:transcriptional regulator with XRE-family HTH domain